MPIAVDRNELQDYVLEADADLPEHEQTVFKIKNLRPSERARLRQKMAKYAGAVEAMDVGQLDMDALDTDMKTVIAAALVGWSNFKDAAGEEVPFETDKKGQVKRELLDKYFEEEWIQELSMKVIGLNSVSGEEAGN